MCTIVCITIKCKINIVLRQMLELWHKYYSTIWKKMYIESFFEFFHKHNNILQYFHNKLSCQFNIGQIKKEKKKNIYIYIYTLTHHNLK